MISKRVRRSSLPQERLRQFALNNSKGIDETRAVTDSDTVLDAINLTVNDDGSLSLRKPLRKLQNVPSSADGGDVLYTIPLFDEAYRMVVYSKDGGTIFKIYDSNNTECAVTVKSNDYYTYEEYILAASSSDSYETVVKGIDLSHVEWVNTPTTVIINNVRILKSVLSAKYYSNLEDRDVLSNVDDALYDEGNIDTMLPRRLIVSQELGGNNVRFIVRIHTPEISTIDPEEDDRTEISANLMLDNPYALRDVYGTTVPRIRGIVAFSNGGILSDSDIAKGRVKDADMPYSTLFESVSKYRYKLINSISAADLRAYQTQITVTDPATGTETAVTENIYPDVIVKAFCDIPTSTSLPFAARWTFSLDGVRWDVTEKGTYTELYPHFAGTAISLDVPLSMYDASLDTKDDSTITKNFYKFDTIGGRANSAGHTEGTRPDILLWHDVVQCIDPALIYTDFVPYLYLRFDIVRYSLDDKSYEATVGSTIFKMPIKPETEYATVDTPPATLGEVAYYKKTLYTFGASGQGNLIYASNVGSNITLLSNVIDLDLQASGEVTAVVPWREYLIVFTTHAVFLLQKADEGFYSKTINAAFGVSKEDSRCVVASLNGVFLKHDDCVYFTYPNLYASTDNVMQFTDVSKPVRNILQEHFSISNCFATLVQERYVLLAPGEKSTECLIYDISKRSWEHYSYPIKLSRFQTTVANGTIAVVDSGEYAGQYHIFKEFEDSFGKYADVLSTGTSGIVPIQFSWDTGQKTDSVSETKQFVESKLMFATLSDTDSFPFTLYVAVDGDPHVTKKDVGTDAPFWKPAPASESDPSLGVLNTNFKLVEDGAETLADSFNVLRQLVVRYSGKGKSIRHLIEGESQSNFKLYETYVRYKSLSNK